jgi:hypothetical protein
MFNVTTESGSVYRFNPDNHTWTRDRGEDAADMGFSSGTYSRLYCEVGSSMSFASSMSNYFGRGCIVHTTPVVSIDNE